MNRTIRYRQSNRRPMALAAITLLALMPTVTRGEAPQANLALGKSYTLWPAPRYKHCTGPGDGIQLTDGESTQSYFWTQRGTVGWTSAPYATVTVDLGRLEPVAGAAMTTAAGKAGVTWPAAVRILVSDDGKVFRDAGDLVSLDHKRVGPWPEGYAIRRLATDALATRGRYVQFVIIPKAGGPYIFTDEVEVLRGPDTLLDEQPAGPIVKAEELFVHWRTRSSLRHRFQSDAAAVEKAIREATLADASAREPLLASLRALRERLKPDAVPMDASSRLVLPLSEDHARLLAVQAALWRAMERQPFSAWAAPTWDPVDPFAPPPTRNDVAVEVHTMLGEYRAAAVNLANAGPEPIEVRLSFEGLPESPAPVYLAVHEVAWTDTGRGVPVAAALPKAGRQGDAWKVRVLPGLVRQVWLTFHVTDLCAGLHEGRVVLSTRRCDPLRVPVKLRVYPFRFPEETTLLVGGWSYTNGSGRYGVTAKNRADLVRHLRDRFVNAPWATSSVMMKFRFAPDDPDTIELETAEMDAWLADWPDARMYMVFLSQGNYSGTSKAGFAKARLGTSEFDRRVGTWITAWVDHLQAKGVRPSQLALLIHDEPHEGTDLSALLCWARAIKKAQPEVILWLDPTYRDPGKAPPELFEVCDVLCPNRPMWLAQGKLLEDFYLDLQRRGKTLHSYSCSGPARLLDPYSYYRLQAWHCWRYGGRGSFFWAFGDNSGASSWNEYLAKAGPYTPLFLDQTTVTPGKHMEAIRESVEDYETLRMLQRAVEAARADGKTGPSLSSAERLLATAGADVLDARGAARLQWHDPKDRSRADLVRVKVLDALAALRGPEQDDLAVPSTRR